MNDRGLKLLMVFSLMIVFGLNAFAINSFLQKSKPNVLSENVSVSGTIYGCILNIIAKPEKRVNPPNYATNLIVDVYNSSNVFLGSVSATTDLNGVTTTNICDSGIQEMGGFYTFKVRGLSHLFMKYENVDALRTAGTDIDFTNGDTIFLYAGETNNIFDNKINSLDISTRVRNLYSTIDEKNDLNQDNKVNSLDVSNTIWNFYMEGD